MSSSYYFAAVVQANQSSKPFQESPDFMKVSDPAFDVQDQDGNRPSDAILALLCQAGDYVVETLHVWMPQDGPCCECLTDMYGISILFFLCSEFMQS